MHDVTAEQLVVIDESIFKEQIGLDLRQLLLVFLLSFGLFFGFFCRCPLSRCHTLTASNWR